MSSAWVSSAAPSFYRGKICTDIIDCPGCPLPSGNCDLLRSGRQYKQSWNYTLQIYRKIIQNSYTAADPAFIIHIIWYFLTLVNETYFCAFWYYLLCRQKYSLPTIDVLYTVPPVLWLWNAPQGSGFIVLKTTSQSVCWLVRKFGVCLCVLTLCHDGISFSICVRIVRLSPYLAI
jgi:hypothetical protein